MSLLAVTFVPPDADRFHPANFWPEGYACVAFCLNIRA
jgi:hypothetical protein